MQSPTCTGIRIRNVHDAHLIFHAARSGMLPIVTRRLDTEERRAVRPGNVYVWEERGPNSRATGLGIERWTDGIPWSASRVRDEFLFYHERHRSADMEFYDSEHGLVTGNSTHNRLVKQTYSVLVETSIGQRKWHLTAYFIPSTSHQLRTVDDMPQIANLHIPEGMYVSAKVGKGRARDCWGSDGEGHVGGRGDSSPPPAAASYPPVFAPFSSLQQSPPPRAREVRPGFGTPVWPDHASAAGGHGMHGHGAALHGGGSPVVAPRRSGEGGAMLPPPLPMQAGRHTYSPRHPLDDEALRSLRGFI